MEVMPDLLDTSVRDATVQRGMTIYNERLKDVLEPAFIGQVVAIHLGTGDYAVGKNSALATRLLRKRHSEGLTVAMDIGTVAVGDPLSLRMSGAVTVGGKP